MMMKGLMLLIVLPLFPQAHAQYFQFSQYNFALQRVSPATSAETNYASLGFLYRNQATGSDVQLNSNFVSACYPLITRSGKRWAGMGLTVMDDRSGGIFKTQEASLSYAISVRLTRYESFSLGFRGLYLQRTIDVDGLFTGSQYVADRGFDESIFNGENLGVFKSDFFTFSSGLSWRRADRSGIRTGYWSLSLFDLNRPGDSFFEANDKLSSTWVASGGFRAYRQGNMSFFPEALFTRNASNNVLNIGMITRCDVNSTGQKPFHVDVITKYVIGRSGIFGLQLHRENFSVGFSYDILIHRDNVSNTGSVEFGLEIRRKVNPVPKARSSKRRMKPAIQMADNKSGNLPVKKNSAVSVTNSAPDPLSPSKPKTTLAERLVHKSDSVLANAKAGKVSHLPFEIEKVTLHFNFEFGSSELDEASANYLDDLIHALRENPHLRIKLTGHTDNIGSASFNMKLSVHRANSIKEYLIEKAIEPSRIHTEGKGLTEPLNSNRTETERAKNRRVELSILYAD